MELWWSSSTARGFCTRPSDIPCHYNLSLLHLHPVINNRHYLILAQAIDRLPVTAVSQFQWQAVSYGIVGVKEHCERFLYKNF